jgi:hypothetical protein
VEKIKEAYKNIKSVDAFGVTGETSEGIKIKMWFLKLPSGEIIVNSAYPEI